MKILAWFIGFNLACIVMQCFVHVHPLVTALNGFALGMLVSLLNEMLHAKRSQ